jgi:hypothetical protein
LRISKCRISAYGNGKDGTFSLADARRERDKAKDLLKEGKDPSTAKQLDKHRQRPPGLSTRQLLTSCGQTD